MAPPAPTRPARAALVAIALVLAASVSACGGGSSDASPGPSDSDPPTASATDAAETTAADVDTTDPDDASAASATLDLCAEVSAGDVGAILTEADISSAKPNAAISAPTCQYFVDWAGSPLSVLQITWNEDGFLDAQRQSNPNATELSGLDDAVAISEDSIVVAGTSGDFQIDAGVELSKGGSVATQDQLVAIAKLTEAL